MRNAMLFVVLVVLAVFAYQASAPYLTSQGIDMNATPIEDTDVESN